MTDLTRPQLLVLAILADGPARQSNATSESERTVSWRTVQVLERLGLAIDVARYKAILTDAGRAVAADRHTEAERLVEEEPWLLSEVAHG